MPQDSRGQSTAPRGGILRRFLLLPAALALAGLAATAQGGGAERAEPYAQPAAAVAGSPLRLRDAAAAPPARSVVLDAVAAERLAAEASFKPRRGMPHKVGFARDIAPLARTEGTAAWLDWHDTSAGGRIAALSITSPQAIGLRLGLLVQRLPEAATLRFYPRGARAVFEVPAREVLATLRRNRQAGSDDPTYWSPHVEGEQMTLEVALPPEAAGEVVEIAVPRLSHLFVSPHSIGGAVDRIGQSGSCEVDAVCFPEWTATANATARMLFVDSGPSYVCSGTLLADTIASGTPFFLSANHCISDQATASTLQTYWFYRASACHSGLLNPGMQTVVGGATLLYASALTDTSFMRLAGTPPAGATYAGWLAAAPAEAAAATALHYPMGDLLKLSNGNVAGFVDCTASQAQAFSCSPSDRTNGKFLSVVFATGVTESGSSGAGLFTNVGSSRYLIGQLRGGASSCAAPNDADYFGRFDLAYAAVLAQWLNPGPTPTFSISKTGSGTVTSSPAGIDCGAVCSAPFANGSSIVLTAAPVAGHAFSGWGGACSGADPMCTVLMNGANGATATFSQVDAALGPALDNTHLVWSGGGDRPFFAQSATAYFGGSAARSGAIADSQRSHLATTVAGPGTLSWYWRVSSELNFDFLSMSLDGVTRASISGEQDWAPVTLSIPAGMHALRWDYVKDDSVASGQDAGWVDKVVFAGSIQPQSGWWWNPAESGRGFFLEVVDGRAFLAAYLYETDGRATWYASSSANAYAGNILSGTLDRYTGGQTLTGSWTAPTASPGSGGNISIRFSDAQNGTLNWAGGTVPIRRFEFMPGGLALPPGAGQPETGWWWNPAESGHGFSLEIQGSLMFLAGYMYEGSGNPLWYLPDGSLSGTAYTGAWAQYANGQTLTGSYVAPVIVNSNVGPLGIQFSSSSTAVLTLPDGRQIPIQRFRF